MVCFSRFWALMASISSSVIVLTSFPKTAMLSSALASALGAFFRPKSVNTLGLLLDDPRTSCRNVIWILSEFMFDFPAVLLICLFGRCSVQSEGDKGNCLQNNGIIFNMVK